MLAQMFILFKAFYNHIKHIRTDTEVRLGECNKVLTIIRIDPYAILQSHETIFLHKSTNTRSHAPATLGNVEYDNAPPPIPSPLFCDCYFLCFHLQHSFPLLGDARISLTVLFYKRDTSLLSQASKHGLCLIVESRPFLESGEKSQKLRSIRYRRRYNDNASKHNRSKHCLLERPQSSLAPRTAF